ncbi:hypothetical protein D1224_15675 [Henriciella barbarensis]|uniref:Uncharacterized protein n=1 Tax=Henriciella barbarensis TaxID=86342 RepID=A0A399QNV5_9PROT|nr:hypothetical protein [Henriciella barbarensis]RIJ20548.1 hypothetical protein D1224_15675 [Henriciella barbarensis]
MVQAKTYDAKVIEVTGGNIRNNHLYLRSALSLIPDDAIGGTNAASPGREISVTFIPGGTVQTDLPEDKLFLRCRSEVGAFFAAAKVHEGDFVLFTWLVEREYEIRKLS